MCLHFSLQHVEWIHIGLMLNVFALPLIWSGYFSVWAAERLRGHLFHSAHMLVSRCTAHIRAALWLVTAGRWITNCRHRLSGRWCPSERLFLISCPERYQKVCVCVCVCSQSADSGLSTPPRLTCQQGQRSRLRSDKQIRPANSQRLSIFRKVSSAVWALQAWRCTSC